jgi:glyoxylase-like metal-dependent hydrolase (beta-lactamase superfamily II)
LDTKGNADDHLRTAERPSQPDQEIDGNLTGIGSVPAFGIGQRALLVQTASGNVLWDCTSLLDEATIEAVRARGGIAAIAVSHPHLAGSLVEWSRAFDNAPIYWHSDNCYACDPIPLMCFGKASAAVDGRIRPDPLRWFRRFDGTALVTR